MSDPTLFDKANEDTPNYDELLAGIKNENGEQKYKNIQEALKALANAQEYIPKLHQEIDGLKNKNSTLEDQYSKSLSVAEKLDELLKGREEDRAHQDSLFQSLQKKEEEPPPPADDDPPPTPQFDEDELYAKFKARQQAEDNARKEQGNIAEVENQIVSLYGEKSVEFLRAKSAEIGMELNELMSLAGRSPKAAMNLLGINPGTKRSFNVENKFNSGNLKTYEDSEIRRNKGTLVGADTATLKNEFAKAGQMAQQLRDRGLSMNDLSDPKNYFKLFNN